MAACMRRIVVEKRKWGIWWKAQQPRQREMEHTGTVALAISSFSSSYQKWTACPSSWAASSSSSSSESSVLLITAALRVWSSSRTDRNLSDRKQTAAQINHAAAKVPTLKSGPNRPITMRGRLNSGFLVVTRAWRRSLRICSLRSRALAHLCRCTNTGLESDPAHVRTWGTSPKAPVCFLKSTSWSFLPVSISLGSPRISLRVRSSSSVFRAACLSNWRRILTARQDTQTEATGWGGTSLIFHCVDILHHSPHVRCDLSIPR